MLQWGEPATSLNAIKTKADSLGIDAVEDPLGLNIVAVEVACRDRRSINNMMSNTWISLINSCGFSLKDITRVLQKKNKQ